MPSAAPATQSATPPVSLPDGIEIFAAGARTADDGTVHTITEADLAACVAAYDPAVHEAPHTVGHPKHNAPAYGWVSRLAVENGVLRIAENKQVEPQFAELVDAGRVKKRSASFYHPTDPTNPKPGIWYLRHVGWLGAQPPAVKGLKDVVFSEGDAEGAINFSEPVTTTQESDDMSKELQEQLAKVQADLAAANEATAKAKAEADAANKAAADAKTQAASFAEKAKADRKAGFVSFAESQVKGGRLLPKDKDMAVATLEALADAQPVEFSEGSTTTKVSPAQWLQDLIANAKPAVSFGEFAGGQMRSHQHQTQGKTDAEIHAAASAHALEKGVSYAEALTAVTTSFTA